MRRTPRRARLRIGFEAHPPERRRRRGQVAACGCCCCCCCLHSLGGLIGSAAAGRSKTLEAHGATVSYWLCLLAALVISCAVGPLLSGEGLAGVLAALILLPGLQLVASLVAAVIAGFTAGAAGVARIWTITWRGLVGSAVGFGIMLIAFKVLAK